MANKMDEQIVWFCLHGPYESVTMTFMLYIKFILNQTENLLRSMGWALTAKWRSILLNVQEYFGKNNVPLVAMSEQNKTNTIQDEELI